MRGRKYLICTLVPERSEGPDLARFRVKLAPTRVPNPNLLHYVIRLRHFNLVKLAPTRVPNPNLKHYVIRLRHFNLAD